MLEAPFSIMQFKSTTEEIFISWLFYWTELHYESGSIFPVPLWIFYIHKTITITHLEAEMSVNKAKKC